MNVMTNLKNSIHRFLQKRGYDFQKYFPPTTSLYEPFHPYRYCPWNEDTDFLSTYEKIKTYTLVDKSRCFELWSLIRQSKKVDGSIIEVGTWRGGTGAVMAKSAAISGIADPVYLCDTFTGVVKASTQDTSYKGGEHSDASIQVVDELMADLDLKNYKILEGIFPDDTGDQVASLKFRLCHIDVDVFESARGVFDWIWKRMSIGGLIVFDDYGFRGTDGITKFVNSEQNNPGLICIYNLNGHGIFVKIKE